MSVELMSSEPKRRKRVPVEQRLWPKVDVRGPDDCWPWTGSLDDRGYGSFRGQSGTAKAHRVVYELSVGPIPPSLHLDHTCHNADASCPGGDSCPHRRCCNPAHLEATTQQENIARGRGGAHHAAKTHCPHGHPYEGDNLIRGQARGRGQRFCRACRNRYQRAWRAAKAGGAQ